MPDTLAYLLARALVALIHSLPLKWVARLGRAGGGLGWCLDARHRRVAVNNLTACFGEEKSPAEIRAIARENFRRIGESYACGIKTAAMTSEELAPCLEVTGIERFRRHTVNGGSPSLMGAIGHFGNFELYARAAQHLDGYRAATTYRALKQPKLNSLMVSLRARSGCLNFERRTEGGQLREAIAKGKLLVGLLSDQHAGKSGVWLPFFGRECSASAAAAIFALRYRMPLHTAICYRTGLGRWRIEIGEEIPTRTHGAPRPVEEITVEVNRAFERANVRDPANWFWVHNRWKKPRDQSGQQAAPAKA